MLIWLFPQVLRNHNSPELLEGVGAGDVRVQDEERRIVLAENVTGKSERTSCTVSSRLATGSNRGRQLSSPKGCRARFRGQRTCSQGLGLNREVDSDAVLLLSLLEDGNHDFGAVVDGKNDVLNTGLNVSLR